MKRIIFSLLTAAICNASSLFAQQTEKTITIQANGQEDVIDLPEGMISTTDSLYLDWISKHYINPAGWPMTTQSRRRRFISTLDRLRRIPAIMMPYNDIMRKFIVVYSPGSIKGFIYAERQQSIHAYF